MTEPLNSSIRPRRVFMTTDCIGGVWNYSLELCRALQPHNVEIMLACMGGEPTAAQREHAAQLPHVQFHSAHYKLEWMHDPWLDVAVAGDWLLNLANSFRPDLIH